MAQLLARTVRRYPFQPPLPNWAVIKLLRPVHFYFQFFCARNSLVFFNPPTSQPNPGTHCLVSVSLIVVVSCKFERWGGMRNIKQLRRWEKEGMSAVFYAIHYRSGWIFAKNLTFFTHGVIGMGLMTTALTKHSSVESVLSKAYCFPNWCTRYFFASSGSWTLLSEKSTNSPQNIQTRNCEHFYLFCLQFLFYPLSCLLSSIFYYPHTPSTNLYKPAPGSGPGSKTIGLWKHTLHSRRLWTKRITPRYNDTIVDTTIKFPRRGKFWPQYYFSTLFVNIIAWLGTLRCFCASTYQALHTFSSYSCIYIVRMIRSNNHLFWSVQQ